MAETVGAESTIREERRPITALFADLVGSTALAERLDQTSWSSFANLLIDELP